MEKVSIIIPTYNHGRFLKDCVDSLINQTYENIEIIICNDASTDNTRQIMEELKNKDSRIVTFNLEKNMKKWYALNYSINQASGALITIMDADDQSLLNRIERQYLCLKEAKAIHCLCSYDNINTKISVSGPLNYLSVDEINNLNIERNGIYCFMKKYKFHGASGLFYKDVWDAGIRFNPPDCYLRLYAAEDSDFNNRIINIYKKTTLLLEPLWLYRRGSTTLLKDNRV